MSEGVVAGPAAGGSRKCRSPQKSSRRGVTQLCRKDTILFASSCSSVFSTFEFLDPTRSDRTATRGLVHGLTPFGKGKTPEAAKTQARACWLCSAASASRSNPHSHGLSDKIGHGVFAKDLLCKIAEVSRRPHPIGRLGSLVRYGLGHRGYNA